MLFLTSWHSTNSAQPAEPFARIQPIVGRMPLLVYFYLYSATYVPHAMLSSCSLTV